MGWLIFAAVLVALSTHPGATRLKAKEISAEQLKAIAAMKRWPYITWAVVCLAMTAGLVLFAVLG